MAATESMQNEIKLMMQKVLEQECASNRIFVSLQQIVERTMRQEGVAEAFLKKRMEFLFSPFTVNGLLQQKRDRKEEKERKGQQGGGDCDGRLSKSSFLHYLKTNKVWSKTSLQEELVRSIEDILWSSGGPESQKAIVAIANGIMWFVSSKYYIANDTLLGFLRGGQHGGSKPEGEGGEEEEKIKEDIQRLPAQPTEQHGSELPAATNHSQTHDKTSDTKTKQVADTGHSKLSPQTLKLAVAPADLKEVFSNVGDEFAKGVSGQINQVASSLTAGARDQVKSVIKDVTGELFSSIGEELGLAADAPPTAQGSLIDTTVVASGMYKDFIEIIVNVMMKDASVQKMVGLAEQLLCMYTFRQSLPVTIKGLHDMQRSSFDTIVDVTLRRAYQDDRKMEFVHLWSAFLKMNVIQKMVTHTDPKKRCTTYLAKDTDERMRIRYPAALQELVDKTLVGHWGYDTQPPKWPLSQDTTIKAPKQAKVCNPDIDIDVNANELHTYLLSLLEFGNGYPDSGVYKVVQKTWTAAINGSRKALIQEYALPYDKAIATVVRNHPLADWVIKHHRDVRQHPHPQQQQQPQPQPQPRQGGTKEQDNLAAYCRARVLHVFHQTYDTNLGVLETVYTWLVKEARGAQPLKLRLLDALYIGFEETNAADKGDEVVLALQYGFFLFFSNIARELDLLSTSFTKGDAHVPCDSVSQTILLYENDTRLMAAMPAFFPGTNTAFSKFIQERYDYHKKKKDGIATVTNGGSGTTRRRAHGTTRTKTTRRQRR